MAILDTMPAAPVVHGLRGVLDYYTWCDMVIVRKWPQWRGIRRTPAVQAQWPHFSFVSRAAKYLGKDIKDTAYHLGSGTGHTWKDLVISLYLTGDRITDPNEEAYDSLPDP